MAASIASCIENFISGQDDSSSRQITDELLEGKTTVTDLIELLGAHLTNTEKTTRARATRLIADVLNNLPSHFLTQTQVSLLVTFLCEKLQDHFSLQGHALYGLLALSKTPHVSGDHVQRVCRDIFREVHIQSLPQADRRSVYNIILNFLTTHIQDVQQLGQDFVYGYIQAMDAEKDPRNLILAFSCALTIIQNFSLGVFVEEMFEVVSCYFPVDFSPSANDPSGIKKEDLILCLRKCLAASPKFAQHCLPLLLEKLTSDLKSAKIDALDTLSACLETYEAYALYEFQSSFFNCIKKEVFLSGDPVVEESALSALQAMVKNLSTGIEQNDRKRGLDGFVDEILTECKSHLLQPELMLMLFAGRLLQSAALGSDTACSQIVTTTVPLLLESHNKHTQATPRYNVITVLTRFIECTSKFKYSKKNPNPLLSAHKDPVLVIYTQALAEDVTSLQLAAIKGFHALLQLPVDNLLDTERSFIATKLVLKSLQPDIEDTVRSKCTECLRYMLSTFPNNVLENVLPVLFSHLQTEPMETDTCARVDKDLSLSVLAAVTTGPQAVTAVLQVLSGILHKPDTDTSLFQAATKCMADIAGSNTGDTAVLSILLQTGATMIHDLIRDKCHCSKWREKLTDHTILNNIAAFFRTLAFICPADQIESFQSMFVNTFMNINSDQNEQKFAPLQAGEDTVYVCLLTPVVCAGPVGTSIPQQDKMLDRLTSLVQQLQSRQAHTHVCKCLATLVNRHKQDESLDQLVSSLLKTLMSNLQTGSPDQHLYHVEALYWMTKALVMMNHKHAAQYTDELLGLLSVESVGLEAAVGVRVILTDQSDVLNKTTRACVRMMYKQRFFIENLPKLIQAHKTAPKSTQKNYLLALSYLIHGLNKQVLAPELPKIYPLLIQSLLCGDLDLQLSTMDTLGDLIHNCPDLVIKQIDSLVLQLLKLIAYKPSMKVRMSALCCLRDLASLPLPVIVPYRNQIVRAIKPVLDDKKRLVRAQAVAASQEWHLLDSSKT